MEEKREVLELLEKMEETSRKQLRTNRILCAGMLVCMVCCVAAVIWVAGMMPRITSMLGQVEGLMTQMGDILGQMELVLQNLETATSQLAKLDLAGMVADVDALVASAKQTMEAVGNMDFETLNKAIQDLAAVIEPLARLSKLF